MSQKLLRQMPEVFLSNTATAATVSRAMAAGQLRKLAPKLYTRNLTDTPEAIVRRNLWQIVAAYMPGALIADRTALENTPAADGSVFLISDRHRNIKLPGIILRPRPGRPPLKTDKPFVGDLYLSSTARAFLENMQPSRTRSGYVARTLPQADLEDRLDKFIRQGGREAINRLRDEIKSIAPKLGLQAEAKKLDTIIGSLQGTKTTKLTAPTARARRSGSPYDPARTVLFEVLHRALRNYPPVIRPAKAGNTKGETTLAFFEAYFSNYIEGTEFEVAEAADIVFKGIIPSARPADAHDILGTYRIVLDKAAYSQRPKKLEEFLSLLRQRHAEMMGGRPEMTPGIFKTKANQAGNTVFVEPDLVNGTLAQGYDLYRSLETSFARAVFMMFLVSEVHPFQDGNGRIARVMMNSELVSENEQRIIIPTVYRGNYLSALKALTQTGAPDPLIRTLDFAQKWTGSIAWGDLQNTQKQLEQSNAFIEASVAEERGIKLKINRESE